MHSFKNNRGKWALALVLLLILSAGVWRALDKRATQRQAVASMTTHQLALSTVELAQSDLVRAQVLDISQGVAISGSIKAVNSAVVKARVAGELLNLKVREGDFVKAGQVLAQIDASQYQASLRQTQQQAESAKAQLDIAQRQYANNQALVEQGFISKNSLETSLSSLSAAQSTYKAALAGRDISAKTLDDSLIRAPIAGQISQRLAQTGERLAIDSKIVEIIDLSRLELEASLSAAESLQVAVGQTAELRVEGLSQTLSAQVVRINPSAQAGSRSVLVYLSLPSVPGLRQGMYAQGSLGTSSVRLLALPVSSVRTDKPQPYVQINSNQRIAHRNVQLGVRGMNAGQAVVAVQGVDDQDSVLRGNVGLLSVDLPLRITQPAMTPTSPAVAAP
ncbi:Macrolide export protein MacA [Polaromonas vacuolata]|uniref:Macrolide export protein MacA n=1 Tax=Polaromonas vacuolata TaxID=37448 RepID=A0A6H2H6H1_9BURK|nr:efflux RND transporter periplasmic adaptor subunit [Polaromonas vacuolata]QJC55471.1 Macrolide export protein MacA [Polaromonas vacuolata]